MAGFLLDVDGPLTLVEFDYPVPFGLLDVAGEDESSFPVHRGALDQLRQAASVEEVVAENQRAGIIPDERLADQEGLRHPLRRGLHGVVETHAKCAPVTEEPPVQVDVFGR